MISLLDKLPNIIPNTQLSDGVINMSGNLNFINYPEFDYPDPYHKNVKATYAQLLNDKEYYVDGNNILLTRGGVDGLDLCLRLFMFMGYRSVALLEPSFIAFEYYANLYGFQIQKHLYSNEYYTQVIGQSFETDVLILCNPNNPTGSCIQLDEIEHILQNHSGPVVIDEAYIEFSGDTTALPFLKKYKNLFILRTFSKAWGRPDLRLGSIITSHENIVRLQKIQPPFQISEYALNQLQIMFSCYSQTLQVVQDTIVERTFLETELNNINEVKYIPSSSNFLFCIADNGSGLHSFLSERSIDTRSFENSIANSLRVTVSNRQNNESFLTAVMEFYEK